MTTPLVSIIIPCFNGAGVVGDAIRSALDQTYRPTEVIVVDDGSTDSSLDVIRSFGDAIRWHAGPHRGACAARNQGLQMAHGELVQFLDADDLLHWNKLQRQVPVALAHPEEVVYADYLRRPCGEGEEYSLVCAKLHDDDPVVFVLRNQLIQTSAPLHRRQALVEIGGFDEALPCSQEFDLHVRLACHGFRFHRLAEALSTMRRSAHSLSSDTTRVLDQHERIIEKAREILERAGGLTERRAEMLAAALTHDARWYARWCREEKARRFLSLARDIHPSGGARHAYGGMSRAVSLVLGPVVLERCARAVGSLGKVQQSATEGDWRQAWTLVSGSTPVRSVYRRGVRALRKQWRMASFRLSEPKGPLPPSRRPLAERVAASVDWLLRAQEATPDGGVAQLYDVARAEWSPSYPETTGYIASTLLRAATHGIGDVAMLRAAAARMGDWLTTQQLPSGAFFGGHVGVSRRQPVVFDTGQILGGLTNVMRAGLDRGGACAESARRAVRWLVDTQDPDGAWRHCAAVLTGPPPHAYDVRVAWALVRYGLATGDESAVQAGARNARWVASLQDGDAWIPRMSFAEDEPPLTHSVAYTIDGLLHVGELCHRSELIDAAVRMADKVRLLQDPETGAVPGSIAPGFVAAVASTNTTANAQMAIIWFRLAEITGGESWREAAQKANAFNCAVQEWDFESPDSGRRGGLRGSVPGHVGYGRYWYMNWTMKFHVDALLAQMGVSIQ